MRRALLHLPAKSRIEEPAGRMAGAWLHRPQKKGQPHGALRIPVSVRRIPSRSCDRSALRPTRCRASFAASPPSRVITAARIRNASRSAWHAAIETRRQESLRAGGRDVAARRGPRHEAWRVPSGDAESAAALNRRDGSPGSGPRHARGPPGVPPSGTVCISMHERIGHAPKPLSPRQHQEVHSAEARWPQPLAPRHPGRGDDQARHDLSRRLPRVVRRRDQERRLGRRRAPCAAGRRARAVGPLPCRRCRAR